MTGAGQFGGNPYGNALQPEPEHMPEPQSASQSVSEPEAESGPVDPGLLMSFLTDFRSAQYEEIRRKRMEELEKTKKGRSQRRPAPVQEEDASFGDTYEDTSFGDTHDTYGDAGQDTYQGAEIVPAQDWPAPVAEYSPGGQPPAHHAGGPMPEPSYPVSDADVQVAACRPEEPTGKRRFPLGLPSFKGLGQSPATA